MHDVPDKDDLLSFAVYRVEGAPWGVSGVNAGCDAWHDFRGAVEGTDFACVHVEFDGFEGLVKVLHVVVRFGRVGAVEKEVQIGLAYVHDRGGEYDLAILHQPSHVIVVQMGEQDIRHLSRSNARC